MTHRPRPLGAPNTNPSRWGSAPGAVVLCFMAAAVFACTVTGAPTGAPGNPGTTGPSDAKGPPGTAGPPVAVSTGQPLQTPDVYTSKARKLHLQVKAEKVTSTINEQSYNNIFSFATSLVGDDGTYTPGTASRYVGAEWHVMPGDQVTIDYINALPDDSFTPVGQTKPQTVAQPINLHTHGLTVRPDGNSDNVLLSIPQGRANRYVIDIPADQHAGLYWYHPHVHGNSDAQVYQGLAGHIVVGRADGDYHEFDDLTVRTMMLRNNVVAPDAAGNLVDSSGIKGTALAPRGTMIYTVNGQASPDVALAPADPSAATPAEAQVWAFTNMTGSASFILSLDEVDVADAGKADVVGRPLDVTVVSVDGTSMPAPDVLTGDRAARGYLLGQGGRVALLVHGASSPTKVVRLVQVQNRSGTGDATASNWTDRKMVGNYRDFSRAVLAVGGGAPAATSRHVDTPTRLTPNLPSSNHDLLTEPVANRRTFVFNNVAPPSETAPNEFPVDFALFPDTPTAQPEVGTVEEWTILNYSSLHHPFHVHAQYNQVVEVDAPVNLDYRDGPDQYASLQYVTDMSQADPADHLQDVVNLPPAKVGADGMPLLGPDGVPSEPGRIVLRMKIDNYLGTYVEHCHRLPHEDRGMMSMVRSIPHDPIVAATHPTAAGSVVDILRSSDRTAVTSLTPFPDVSTPLVTAVGDVDNDAIPDVAVATTTAPARVKVFSGASGYRSELPIGAAFDDATTSIGSLALGDLNGDGHDDLVVGQGTGGSRVVVVDATNGVRLSDFAAYDDKAINGVDVAADIVEFGGRVSLITGAGPGGPPTVNVYNFDLFGDANGTMPDLHAAGALKPLLVASADGADAAYRGGIHVSTGYPFAAKGGFASVLVAPRSGPVVLRTFAVGGHHQHQVSTSGAFLADDYQPGSPRVITAGPTLDLSAQPLFSDGAAAAFVSTPSGADVVAVPAAGGPIQRWTATPTGTFDPADPYRATGTAVAAM